MRTAVAVLAAVVLLAAAWAAVTTRYWYATPYIRVDRWTGHPQAWGCEDRYGDLPESALKAMATDPWGIGSVPAPVVGTVCRWR